MASEEHRWPCTLAVGTYLHLAKGARDAHNGSGWFRRGIGWESEWSSQTGAGGHHPIGMTTVPLLDVRAKVSRDL